MSSPDNAAVPPIDDTLRASLEGNAAGEALLRAMRADPSFHEDVTAPLLSPSLHSGGVGGLGGIPIVKDEAPRADTSTGSLHGSTSVDSDHGALERLQRELAALQAQNNMMQQLQMRNAGPLLRLQKWRIGYLVGVSSPSKHEMLGETLESLKEAKHNVFM